MSKIFFSEKQMAQSIWVWLLLFFLLALFIYVIVVQIFLGQPFGNQPTPDYVLIITGALIVLFFWMFASMRLVTEVREDGWYYKFKPFHNNWQVVKWDEVEKVYVRKYRPLYEYGGWGMRLGLFGKGRAFSVKGRQGLQITLKNKQQVLFGTQKAAELEKAINQVFNK